MKRLNWPSVTTLRCIRRSADEILRWLIGVRHCLEMWMMCSWSLRPLFMKFIAEASLWGLSVFQVGSWRNPASLLNLLQQKSVNFGLYKRYILNEHSNKTFKNELTNKIWSSKKDYYKRTFANYCCRNLRKTWKNIRLTLQRKSKGNSVPVLTEDGFDCHDRTQIANIFNDYFVRISHDLDRDIPVLATDPRNYINCHSVTSFFLEPVSPKEVFDIFVKLKRTKYSIKVVPVSSLSSVMDVLSVPLSTTINRSFSSGVFPEVYKYSEIIPIFKTGCTKNKTNYCPISLLPTFIKVFERRMFNRLSQYFSRYNNIISKNQFGFQRGKSTVDALLCLLDFIYRAFNAKEHSIDVFIDLRKTFDTVNIPLLCKKLSLNGVRCIPLDWFESYLLDRTQTVWINSLILVRLIWKILALVCPRGQYWVRCYFWFILMIYLILTLNLPACCLRMTLLCSVPLLICRIYFPNVKLSWVRWQSCVEHTINSEHLKNVRYSFHDNPSNWL